MKRILTLTLIAFYSTSLFAQTEADSTEGPWKKGAVIGLNFAQTYLENWQGGGSNAINGTAILSMYANYSKGTVSWDNTLDAAYGQSRIGKLDDGANFQKTDDRIEINSKFGVSLKQKNLYWATLGTFRTQWDAGYDYSKTPSKLISDPFAPAYVLLGTGIDYKPKESFSVYFSPATAKITIVDNQRLANMGAFGVQAAEYDDMGNLVTEGENIRYELGGFLKVQYSKSIVKNVKLNTKADFFANYIEKPGNIDVNWETLIAFKINEFLSASLSTHLIYDDDINIALDRDGDGENDGTGPRVQFKEVFSLGIQYQF